MKLSEINNARETPQGVSHIKLYSLSRNPPLLRIYNHFSSTLAPRKIGSFLTNSHPLSLTKKILNQTGKQKFQLWISLPFATAHRMKKPMDLASKKLKSTFPSTINQIKIINNHIGGSTGAKLVEDKQKKLYVQKTSGKGAIIKPDHLKSEYYTNKAYQALGVNVPEVALYNRDTGELITKATKLKTQPLVMLSKFIPGNTVELQDYMKQHPKELTDIQKIVQKSFVTDCLLANWDVIGLNYDNIRIDLDTKEVWRVDNGSGLNYRAQGGLKGDLFTDHVGELDTLRNPSINPEAAKLFGNISHQEIIKQIDLILPLKKEFLASIPAELKEKMTKRFDSLIDYKNKLLSA